MLNFPVVPPIIVEDTPQPRRLTTLNEARAYVREMLHVHRPPVWRETLERLDGVKNVDEAIEAIGALREMLALEGLIAG